MLLNVGSTDFQDTTLGYCLHLREQTNLQLLPAFWPPIQTNDLDWNLLKNNCKYEFRNYPNEFHNGGTWPMVNGFFGLALLAKNKKQAAEKLLEQIDNANSTEDFGFYENFNTETEEPNGVKHCAWSAAAAIILHQNIHTNFKFLV